MPHRPEGQGSASLSPGGVVKLTVAASSVYTPPRVAGSTAAAIMRQQTSCSSSDLSSKAPTYASSGVVTPVVKTKGGHWLGGTKSCDSTDRSTATTTDDSRSIATLTTEDEREATASALLMVARAAEREQQQHYLKGMVVDGGSASTTTTTATAGSHGERRPSGVVPAVSSSASTCSASTVPLKKRKKQLDILRRQQPQTEVDKDACHVSPVSLDSSPSSSQNRAPSYDSKDLGSSLSSPKVGEATQELLDSAKVHSTAQIGSSSSSSATSSSSLPVAQVLIPHFPTLLHQVLADPKLVVEETGGPIVAWLADGEAWTVENWNAMRRQVLPKYFSDLRDEHGSSCGTIDAFLHNIDAWGFEEIKSGPHAGAYRHHLFIRGAQKLCVKMRFHSGEDANKKVPKTVSPSGRSAAGETERMMLQVPMLATADSKKGQALPPNKRPRYEGNLMGISGHGPLHWPYSNEGVMWGGASAAAGQAPFGEMPNARAFGMRAAVAMNGGSQHPFVSPNPSYTMDPRLQLLRIPTSESMVLQQQQQQQQQRQQQPFQYNPPQVRSGRGALRGMASATQPSRAAMVTSPSTTPSFRHGFPVSNRGKGSRKSAACRTPLSSSDATKTPAVAGATSETSSKPSVGGVSLTEAQRIGNSVKGGVAVAISRKTKRKLPMAGARKAEASSSESGATSTTTTVAAAEKAAV